MRSIVSIMWELVRASNCSQTAGLLNVAVYLHLPAWVLHRMPGKQLQASHDTTDGKEWQACAVWLLELRSRSLNQGFFLRKHPRTASANEAP